MTPERLEQLKKKYLDAGYTYAENQYYHMFDDPTGEWSDNYSKQDGGLLHLQNKWTVNLVKSE